MAKPARKGAKRKESAKKSGKTTKNNAKTTGYVGCLLELHKLQGALLKQLEKEV